MTFISLGNKEKLYISMCMLHITPVQNVARNRDVVLVKTGNCVLHKWVIFRDCIVSTF